VLEHFAAAHLHDSGADALALLKRAAEMPAR